MIMICATSYSSFNIFSFLISLHLFTILPQNKLKSIRWKMSNMLLISNNFCGVIVCSYTNQLYYRGETLALMLIQHVFQVVHKYNLKEKSEMFSPLEYNPEITILFMF